MPQALTDQGQAGTVGAAPPWARAAFAALCAAYLGLCAHYLSEVGDFVVDDVFIIFRYADNFAAGHGLVYNPGEAVEGYTSFTWTLGVGVLAALKLPLITTCQAIGVALGLGTLAITWWIARRLLRAQEWLALFAVALVALNRSTAVWAVEPLETKLFGFAIAATGALWLLAGPGGRWRRLPVVGLAAAFMALTRPEGFMYAGWLLVAGVQAARRAGASKNLLINACIFVGIVLAHLAFRLSVYDAWLPNTFAAKVGGLELARGAHYLGLLAQENLLLISGALVLSGLVLPPPAPAHRALRNWAALVVVSSFAYWWAIGGDYFEFRFFEPIGPLWALLAALGLAGLSERLRPTAQRAGTTVMAGLALAGGASSVLSPYPGDGEISSPERSAKSTEQFALAARWLATNVPRDEVIAIRPAGVIAYLSRLHCLDELGLNDRQIALTAEVVEGPAGHQRSVTVQYLAERGATYYVGHPMMVSQPAAPGRGFVSAEVAPGLYLIFKRLAPGAKLDDRVYRLGQAAPPLQGWAPVPVAP